MGTHKAAIALLLDGVHGSHERENPALGGVVLGGAGDESEVLRRELMGIHKAAIALLLDRVHPLQGLLRDAVQRIIGEASGAQHDRTTAQAECFQDRPS